MGSRATGVPQIHPTRQELHQKGEVGKNKNVPVDGRNRRVLGDIGNLVKIPGEAKNRPVTRNFSTQLLAQAPLKNLPPAKKQIATDAASKQRHEADVLAQKVTEVVTLKETTVAVDHVGRVGVSKKKVPRSLTSVLSARSKAVCGLANRPLILNIDEEDLNNELAQVEYVEDIYKFYKATEEENRVPDYMHLQPEINSRMRSILIDWLIEVHNKFELVPETLYLTVNLVDRYLSMKVVLRRELQLVGISSMLIASKYEEIWAPEVKDFITISDNAYTREQILLMEKAILGKLEWYLTVPTPYVFLARYIKASIPFDKQMENLVFYMAELGIMYYDVSIKYPPSLIAASAVYAARKVLNKTPAWTETLKHHTGSDEHQLMECVKALISFGKAAPESKLKASFKKYSNPDRCCVTLLASAKSVTVADTH